MNGDCECPICLDTIIGTTNKTTTECGHNFHTKCLMQNAAHNGFGCPYCRNILAELPKLYSDSDSDTDSDDSFIDEYEKNENYILTGLRWFCQRINNEELELAEENENVQVTQNEHDLMAPLEDVNIKFKSSCVTYEELLEYVLEDYKNGNHRNNLTNNNSYKKVYTKLREIDANFRQNLRLSRDINNNINGNRNTDYYEKFVNEYQIPIRETNNIM